MVAHSTSSIAGAANANGAGGKGATERRSWAPMVGLFLAQVLMSFNVAALPISLGGMGQDFGVPPPRRARRSSFTASQSPRS